jgi:hypothetical protein
MYSQRYMDRLFINLKVLSKIEDGQKLYTKEEYLMLDDGTSYKQMLLRWWHREDRITTLNKIQEVVESSVSCGQNAINSELMIIKHFNQNYNEIGASERVKLRHWETERDKFIQTDNINLLKSLASEMDNALFGLRKLKDTYNDDKTLGSKLELEIEILERNVEKYRDFYNNYVKNKNLLES